MGAEGRAGQRAAARYRPRRPSASVLYRCVQEHLETCRGSGLGGKWIELLRDAVPRISRIAVLANSGNPANAASVGELEAVGPAMRVKIVVHDAHTATTLDRALAAIAASDAQGLVVTNDPFFTLNREKIAQFAMGRKLPSIYFFAMFADPGGLLVYGASLDESYRKAPLYVDRILKGDKADDLAVDQPTKFDPVVNMKTARTIGANIPPSLLARATPVIE